LSFVHLHTHSEYSLLDGANRLGDLIRRAKAFEMPALALTDHGCLYGAWTFQKLARREGLKPIVGMEAYVAPGDRRERARSGQAGKAHYHLVLLARDAEGYRNLIRLSSLGYTEGFYYRPRVDRETLARHSGGIIVTSACMAGELARHLVAGNEEGAREVAGWYADTFPGRYYLEVQAHGTPGQAEVNEMVLALGSELGLPAVATNDAHFLRHRHHPAHDILVCIGTARNHDDEDRLRYDDGLYFKSPEEMAAAFPDRPDVIENTLRIADEVALTLEKKYRLPSFPLPDRFSDPNDYLVHLAEAGARERYAPESAGAASPDDATLRADGATSAGHDSLPPEVRQRLDYELEVILKTGYAGYFLITWDFIRWARDNGIPVGPGRGSAAGSLVSYALRITDLDPIEYGLLFERFLNPERIRPDREDDPEPAGAELHGGPGRRADPGREGALRVGRTAQAALRLLDDPRGALASRVRARGRRGDRAGAAVRLRADMHAGEGGQERRDQRRRDALARPEGRARYRNPVRHELPRGRRDAQDGLPGPQDADRHS